MRNQGGISIVCREEEVWEVEGAQSFVPNMVSFTVTSVQKRSYIIGSYMPPNDLLSVHHITHALTCGPEGVGKLLVGDLNACLAHIRDQ